MTIEYQNGIAYNRWSKSKYRDIYPTIRTWKVQKNKRVPLCKYISKDLLSRLYSDKNSYTYDERKAKILYANRVLLHYNKKIKVLKEIKEKYSEKQLINK